MKPQNFYADYNLNEFCMRSKKYAKHIDKIKHIYQRNTCSKTSLFVFNDSLITEANKKKNIRTQFDRNVSRKKIEKENGILLGKLLDLCNKTQSQSISPQSIRKNSSNSHSNYKSYSKSIKGICRNFPANESIIKENQKITERLLSIKSQIRVNDLKQNSKKQNEYKMRIIKYEVDSTSKQIHLKAMNFHKNFLQINCPKTRFPSLSSNRSMPVNRSQDIKYNNSKNSQHQNNSLSSLNKIRKKYSRSAEKKSERQDSSLQLLNQIKQKNIQNSLHKVNLKNLKIHNISNGYLPQLPKINNIKNQQINSPSKIKILKLDLSILNQSKQKQASQDTKDQTVLDYLSDFQGED